MDLSFSRGTLFNEPERSGDVNTLRAKYVFQKAQMWDAIQTFWNIAAGQLRVECPAFYVPVLMRETGQKEAEDGEGQEANT